MSELGLIRAKKRTGVAPGVVQSSYRSFPEVVEGFVEGRSGGAPAAA